jgi:anthranilate synthase/aminodeoxychorismate synthase-like glutamine amidotransferase
VILVIDNYDSFTWNLVQYLGELGAEPRVERNDAITVEQIAALAPEGVVISPGPGRPEDAGVSLAVAAAAPGRWPLLGVCLGHQCIGALHGMTVTRHAIPMHGKTSPISHDGRGIFSGLSNPFTATRYHSLVVLADTVPRTAKGTDGWTVSAWTDEDDGLGGKRRVVMGLRRAWADPKKAPLEGVQFHPESFLTDEGPKLLANFLAMGARGRKKTGARRASA